MPATVRTITVFPLDDSQRDFNINFDYLARKFVKVSVLDSTLAKPSKELVLGTDFRFTTKTTLNTTIAWGPNDGYDRIEIRRVTSTTERVVDFADGSILKAGDLNSSQVQAIHIAEEARDSFELSLSEDLQGNLDAEGRRITNLGEATSDKDAITFGATKSLISEAVGKSIRTGSTISPMRGQLSSSIVGLDQNGQPYGIPYSYPEEMELAASLASPSGSTMVGWNDATVGNILDRIVDSKAMAYDILVVYGQSNALGQAGTAGNTSEWPTILDGNLMWDRNALKVVPTTQQLYSTGTGDNHSTGHAWGEFINEYLRLRPNRRMVLMMGAIGGTSIAQLSKGAGTNYYERMVAGVANLKAYMVANEMPVGDVYCMFHQGETDMSLGTTYTTYRDGLLTLIDNMAADIQFKQFGICVVGTPATRPSYRYDSIQLAQRSVVTLRPNVFLAFEGCGKFATADNTMTSEGTHYTQRGYNTMGNAAARALVEVITTDGSRIQQSSIESSQLGRVLTPNYMKAVKLAAYVYPNGSDFAFRHAGNGSGQVRSAGVRSIGINTGDPTRLDIGLSVDPQYILNFALIPRTMKGIDLFTEITRVGNTLRCYLKGHVTIGMRFDTGQLYSTASAPPVPLNPADSHYLNSLFTLTKESEGSLILTHPANLTIPMVCEFSPLGGLDVIKQGVLAVQQLSTTQTKFLFNPATAGDYGAVCALARFVDLTIPWTALLATRAPSTIEFQLDGIVGIH